MSNTKISIVIPNLNGLEHLKTLYPSVAAQNFSDYKLILVDNGSSDGSVEFTRTNHPQFEIIEFDYNTGFAKAVNEGIKKSLSKHGSDYILLLNNDIELKSDFLLMAVNTFDIVTDAGSLAVKMMNYFSRDVIDDTGNFITKKGGTPYPRGNGQKDTGQFDKPEYIFGACAGAAFYRKEVFEKIGLFDEDFFAYLEDIDLSFRAQLAGFKCYYEPKAVCYHKRGGSSISTYRFQVKMNERNVVWLRLKNYPFSLYLKYQPRFVISRIIKFIKLLKTNGFKVFLSALYGYLLGLIQILGQIPKRRSIQKMKTVSSEYIYSLYR